MTMNKCIAYGDCNTEGIRQFTGQLWAERVAQALDMPLTNCGHTMSTTRELRRYAQDYPPATYRVAMIQYGLVDSWLTFRGAPYVLYYPDSLKRKLARKLVKKLKKWARSFHLQARLGAVEQVPLDEYLAHIRTVVSSAPTTLFVLVGTAPNKDESRNPRILRYNAALMALAGQSDNTLYVDAYDALWDQRGYTLMADGTHLTDDGHALLAEKVISVLRPSLALMHRAPHKTAAFA
ncbi:SGNH/GDSL hydrolase family protein [Marinobacter fonticola]|uniref:SGNH/GDSL hydrolase family protein n=1 Tax=Marinobacter fonticola TaxID=2603215 RepID=UPI001D0DB9F2|nr:GDSL-type esterase/lipase family protein [Marinobacter fonticola]